MALKENQNYMAQDVSSDFRRSFYENREINNNNDISPSRSLLIKNNQPNVISNTINTNNNGSNFQPDLLSIPPLKFLNLDELQKLAAFGKKIFPDSRYEGEILNGKRHGKGVMIYQSGRYYEGDWVNDYREGKGFEKYSSGNSYEGQFIKGKPEGKGIYTWNNGEIYDGEWKDGLKHGDGIWKGISGDSYIGEWKFSKADGYGVHIWKTGDRYEGEWKACLKHGNGTDIFASGDSYIGQYKFGKPCGYGRYIWKDGSTYVGEFYDGLKSGFGKWRKNNSQKTNMYEGQYFKDKKQGFGIFKWASGNVYRGQYKNDERDGIGEMIWTDGSRYKGMWAHGIQHGYGKMIFPNGEIKEGRFENNVYKGVWKAEIPFDSNFNIMELSPPDMNFSEEMQSMILAENIEKPKTSYSIVRESPDENPRFMTAHENIIHTQDNRTPLYKAPIYTQNRCQSKDATIKRKINCQYFTKRAATQNSTANQTFYGKVRKNANFGDEYEYESFGGSPQKAQHLRKSEAQTNASTINKWNTKGGQPKHIISKIANNYRNVNKRNTGMNKSMVNNKKVWIPAGNIRYTGSPLKNLFSYY